MAGDGGGTDAIASAVAAAKLGLSDQLSELTRQNAELVSVADTGGRTCLHYATAYGHEACVAVLLDAGADPAVRDAAGCTPLHLAALHGHPHTAYLVARALPAACSELNGLNPPKSPIAIAQECERGEVLNAMLLACAGDVAPPALDALRCLLQSGAVPDTWAPNGSSALMTAASVDNVPALLLLIEHGATVELQDALGRTALMFAAGNCAAGALRCLLEGGASLARRDRRGRPVLEYAPHGSDVAEVLEGRLAALEQQAEAAQAALLEELSSEAAAAGGAKKKDKGDKGAVPKVKRKKKGSRDRDKGGGDKDAGDSGEACGGGNAAGLSGGGGGGDAGSPGEPCGDAARCESEGATSPAGAGGAADREDGEEARAVEWQVVAKGPRRGRARGEPGGGGGGDGAMRRSGSGASLCSSSGESHATDVSMRTASTASGKCGGRAPPQARKSEPPRAAGSWAQRVRALGPSTADAATQLEPPPPPPRPRAGSYQAAVVGVEPPRPEAPAAAGVGSGLGSAPEPAPADGEPGFGAAPGGCGGGCGGRCGALEAQVAALQSRLAGAERALESEREARHGELLAVLRDAAAHEAQAVADAVAAERAAAGLRLASLLQGRPLPAHALPRGGGGGGPAGALAEHGRGSMSTAASGLRHVPRGAPAPVPGTAAGSGGVAISHPAEQVFGSPPLFGAELLGRFGAGRPAAGCGAGAMGTASAPQPAFSLFGGLPPRPDGKDEAARRGWSSGGGGGGAGLDAVLADYRANRASPVPCGSAAARRGGGGGRSIAELQLPSSLD